MNFARPAALGRIILGFTVAMILFFGYSLFSQDDSKASSEAEKDPLTRYIEHNDVYQGSDFAAAVKSGRQGFRNRNYEYARDKFRIAQALSSNHPVPYFFEAHCLFAEGDYFMAYDALMQGFKFFPEWVRLNFDLSAEYRFEDELENQKSALLAESADSDDFKTWFVLGYVLYYTGDLERSVIAFNKVLLIQKRNNNSDIASKIAEKFLIFLYDRGVSSKPLVDESHKTMRSWKRQAILHLQGKEYEKAVISCGEEGMKFRNAEALFWMSMFLTADDSFEYAFSMLMRAAAIDAQKIEEIPSINDVFDADKLLEIKNSAKSVRDKLLISLFAGNQYAVIETLKSEDAKNFTQPEIDTLYLVLKYRDKLPHMPVISGTSKVDDNKKTEKPIIEKPENKDDSEKPVKPDNAGNEVDLEELKKAEELKKKENKEKADEALKFGKTLFTEEKFKDATEQCNLVLSHGKQVAEDYFTQAENAEVFILLAKSNFCLENFELASTNLQEYLNVAGDSAKSDTAVFFADMKQTTFEQKYKNLEIFCTLNDKSYAALFIKSYIDYFQNNLQSAADGFSEVFLNLSSQLAGWYVKELENKGVSPTTSPKIKAKNRLLKAEKYLNEKTYDAALIEYKKAYNNLDDKDNVQALTGIVVTSMFLATKTISIAQRMNYYTSTGDYIRGYLTKIGEDNWKDFTLDLKTKYPDDNDYKAATALLEKHLIQKPLDFAGYYLLGFVHYFAEEYKDAYEAYDKYVKLKNNYGIEVDYFMSACKNR